LIYSPPPLSGDWPESIPRRFGPRSEPGAFLFLDGREAAILKVVWLFAVMAILVSFASWCIPMDSDLHGPSFLSMPISRAWIEHHDHHLPFCQGTLSDQLK